MTGVSSDAVYLYKTLLESTPYDISLTLGDMLKMVGDKRSYILRQLLDLGVLNYNQDYININKRIEHGDLASYIADEDEDIVLDFLENFKTFTHFNYLESIFAHTVNGQNIELAQKLIETFGIERLSNIFLDVFDAFIDDYDNFVENIDNNIPFLVKLVEEHTGGFPAFAYGLLAKIVLNDYFVQLLPVFDAFLRKFGLATRHLRKIVSDLYDGNQQHFQLFLEHVFTYTVDEDIFIEILNATDNEEIKAMIKDIYHDIEWQQTGVKSALKII